MDLPQHQGRLPCVRHPHAFPSRDTRLRVMDAHPYKTEIATWVSIHYLRHQPRTVGKKIGRSKDLQQEKKEPSSAVMSNLPPITPVASTPFKQVHRAALLASVTGRSFEDVKFFAYSRRTRNGAVSTPLPLLANSTLIRKASSHFDYVFAAGFAEGGLTDMDAPFPTTKTSTTELYDYMSDSDLEDEEDEISETPAVIAGDGVEEATEDEYSRLQKDKDDGELGKLSSEVEVHVGQQMIAKPGRVVFLDDIAYATWKAFIFYAYFEEIEFAPLKSEQKTRPKDREIYETPICSPKSMYRLAEKYDIAPLKEKAANDIKAKLSPHNILEEIFSTFTSLYPGIQEVELEYLHANIKDAGIQARLPSWLEAMEKGLLPKGAAGIVASLIKKLNTPVSPPVTVQLGMKKCPGGCTTSNYCCQYCGRTF
ncbi:hypothetical protein C8Q80DRAFT_1183395 [Daedaleopsis nitida]|nr:hypothetical protein C8Q80DRAFT_1183395 [Daedaleopsis nitida]